jgi:hypothetical protein
MAAMLLWRVAVRFPSMKSAVSILKKSCLPVRQQLGIGAS